MSEIKIENDSLAEELHSHICDLIKIRRILYTGYYRVFNSKLTKEELKQFIDKAKSWEKEMLAEFEWTTPKEYIVKRAQLYKELKEGERILLGLDASLNCLDSMK